MLQYKIEPAPFSLIVEIREKGSRRRLYLDTLKSLARAEDHAPLKLLIDIHKKAPNVSRSLDTVDFQRVEVPLIQAKEVLKALSSTKRLFFKQTQIEGEWSQPCTFEVREKNGLFSAFFKQGEKEFSLVLASLIYPDFVLFENSLFPIKTPVERKWLDLFSKGEISLTGREKKRLLEDFDLDLSEEKVIEPIQILPELHLTDATGCFANLKMRYAHEGVVSFEDFSPSVGSVKRIEEEERLWEKDLLEAGFIRKKVGKSHYYCPGDKVFETLQFLSELGWNLFSFQQKQIRVYQETSCQVEEKNGAITLKGEVSFSGVQISLEKVAKNRSPWISIGDRDVGFYDPTLFQELPGTWEEEALELRKIDLGAYSHLLEKSRVQWNADLEKLINEGAKIEMSLPGVGFKGTLLPYQQEGLNWLAFLKKWSFSGLLADEMGLGKTVQVLALFSRIGKNFPLLIVAPSSLLYQWKKEIESFLPGYPVTLYTKENEVIPNQGIVITSYAILRRRVEALSNIEFEVLVLDESSAIKTKGTKTLDAALQLKGKMKIALNGTPVENRKEELFSQFQFLMPTLRYESGEVFKKKSKPFILRRKKEDVDIELPEKREIYTYVEMNEDQKRLYDAYLSESRETLLSKVQKEGMQKHRLEVFEKILRLRQIASDPRLMGESILGSKIERLIDDISDHKILIFSQFTTYLKMIEEELLGRGIPSLYLDGKTSKEKRADLVREFQEEQGAKVFLLSLKAGGVGLNLTEADYVFIMDPWWNEAVENQAIDRAHRLGRKKKVIAKRYITLNSIEEKMLKMKEEKSGLAADLLEEEAFQWTDEGLFELLT